MTRSNTLRENAYSIEGRVRFSEVDHTGTMTLPSIINYFQDCSTFQSEELGLGIEHSARKHCAWILSSWQIVVKRSPRLGETIRVSTWASGFNRFFGDRNFCMQDKEGAMIACANSVWVYMDIEKGRPVRPEPEEVEAYGIGEPLELVQASRKLTLPEEGVAAASFPVRRHQIDTNEHVNNCQYVQMALEVFPEDRTIREIRVAYKKSAVYGDVIYPWIATEDERTVIELCDEQKKPYAVVELHTV